MGVSREGDGMQPRGSARRGGGVLHDDDDLQLHDSVGPSRLTAALSLKTDTIKVRRYADSGFWFGHLHKIIHRSLHLGIKLTSIP